MKKKPNSLYLQSDAVLDDHKQLKRSAKKLSLKIKDISLQRLYGILFTYCGLYTDYNFKIVRYPKYYLLVFNAWGD